MRHATVRCGECGAAWDAATAGFCGRCGARLDTRRTGRVVPHTPRGGRQARRGAAVVGTVVVLSAALAVTGPTGDRGDPTGGAVTLPTSGAREPPAGVADVDRGPAPRCRRGGTPLPACLTVLRSDLPRAPRWQIDDGSLTTLQRDDLVAFDPVSGRLRWRLQLPRGAPGRDRWVADDDERVLVSGGGRLRVLAVATGGQRWTAPSVLLHAGVLGTGTARFVVTGTPVELPGLRGPAAGSPVLARTVADGSVRWRVDPGLAAPLDATVVPGGLLLLRSAREPDLVAVDVDTGGVRWRHAGGGRLVGAAAGAVLLLDAPRGEPGRARRLRAVDAVTGAERWTLQVAQPTARVQVRSDVVLVAGERDLIAVEVTDGSVRWHAPGSGHRPLAVVPDDFWRQPRAAAAGPIVSNLSGQLLRLDPATGATVWRTAVGPGFAFVHRERVLWLDAPASDGGGLRILDAHDGREIARVAGRGQAATVSLAPLVVKIGSHLVRVSDDVG